MKALHAFLISFLILLGQVHACQTTYVLPDGKECFKCVALKDNCRQKSTPSLKSALHGDCHDCCKIKSCDNKGKPATVTSNLQPFNLDIDLPVAVRQPALVSHQQFFVIPVFSENCPATGPPSTRSSRAPPISDSRLTFA
jgi:hypothetical protein